MASSEMKVNGYHLIERREETLVDHNTIEIYSRSIDDRSYVVTKTRTEDKDVVKVVTDIRMTQEHHAKLRCFLCKEVKQFEEDWSNLWNPRDQELVASFFG